MLSKRLHAAFVFLSAFGLNLYLAFPSSSPYRDAGDFGAAVSTLGVAHPPGYPLYVLLGKVFQLILPLANPLYRLNLFSALCIAAAAVFLFALLVRLAGVFAGAAGALFFILLPAVFSQAGLSEIYALNAALTAGFLYLLLSADHLPVGGQWRRWIFFAFGIGLACGNHQTILALVPAAALILFREWRAQRLRLGLVFLLCSFFLVGFSINIASMLRAAAGARYIWGEPGNFSGWIHLLARADYGAATLSTRHSAASADQAILFWFKSWVEQWGKLGTLFWIAGSLWVFRHIRRKSWGGVVLTLWIFSGPVFGFMARLDAGELSQAILEPAMILPSLAAALMVGAFVGEMWRRGIISRGLIVAGLGLNVLFVGSPAVFQHRQRNNFMAEDYGRNLFRTSPPHSVLLMISDGAIFSALGRQEVFQERPDVRLLVNVALPWRWRQYRRQFPDLFAQGQDDGGRELIRSQFQKEKIFTEGIHPDLQENLCPHGMADAAAWPARGADCVSAMEESDGLWKFYVRRVPPAEVLAADYYSRDLAKTAASNAYNTGLLLREAGREESAQRAFARALFWSPERWMRWTELF